jgi:hypothetical protein
MKGNIPVRIEPFQLERWMTKYEVNVKWDIAESGMFCPQYHLLMGSRSPSTIPPMTR